MTIGDKIKRLRIDREMTQEELGSAIGVQKAAINKYETGVVVNLKQSVIANLAKALDVNPVWLMDEESDWPPVPREKDNDENELVAAWRNAEDWQRKAVRKLLNMKGE